jgi:Amt family ammonium transporter
MIGFVSTAAAPGGVDGLVFGGGLQPLVLQTLTALFAILWSGLATLVVGLAIKATIGWRIPEEDEVEGIDFTEHGESGYDLFGPGGARRTTSVLAGAGVQARPAGPQSTDEEPSEESTEKQGAPA